MKPNRVFFPQLVLDQWIAEERIQLTPTELFIPKENRRYRIEEAFHILREVAGGGDERHWSGRVKTRGELEPTKAEIFEDSIVLDDNAYEVVPGFVGELVFDKKQAPVTNDSDLESFLLKAL